MLPPKLKLPADQQQLLDLYRKLSPEDRAGLVSYAAFLAQRESPIGGEALDEPQVPKEILRPESESVVGAIRRLTQTFAMLDRDALFHETSALMTAHIMQGRPASEVIDELEILFRQHYEQGRSGNR
ncbi:MAG: hypothetical protein KDJ27_03760 [Gammaproteobacteria bacterium]|nr:hypothetical protein [Gammaproteobacteria bacterium]